MAAKADAIALLQDDHRKVEELFEKFEATKGVQKKQALAKQICLELTVHSMIEEEIFYPACKGKIDDDLLKEAYVEHDGAKVLIAEIEGAQPDEEFYDAKVEVLSEQIEHHIDEEEDDLFTQARAAGLDMADLGARIEKRKQELTAQFESKGLPTPETTTFTGDAPAKAN